MVIPSSESPLLTVPLRFEDLKSAREVLAESQNLRRPASEQSPAEVWQWSLRQVHESLSSDRQLWGVFSRSAEAGQTSEGRQKVFSWPPSLELLGWALVRFPGSALEIDYWEVLSAQRGKGLSWSVFQALLQLGPSQGVGPWDRVWLEVHEANQAAIKIYESFYFQKVGYRPRYYKDGGGALVYEWCRPV